MEKYETILYVLFMSKLKLPIIHNWFCVDMYVFDITYLLKASIKVAKKFRVIKL